MIKCIHAFSTFGGFNLGFKVSLFLIGNETHACRHFHILSLPKLTPLQSLPGLDIELIKPSACQIKTKKEKKLLVGCTEQGCPSFSIMISMNYWKIEADVLGWWYIGGWCPRLKDCPQNFTVALKASLLGQLFIFRTIFQPWALSSDIPAAERGLFTKYTYTIICCDQSRIDNPTHRNITSKTNNLVKKHIHQLAFILFSLHKIETEAAEENIKNYIQNGQEIA